MNIIPARGMMLVEIEEGPSTAAKGFGVLKEVEYDICKVVDISELPDLSDWDGRELPIDVKVGDIGIVLRVARHIEVGKNLYLVSNKAMLGLVKKDE